MCERKRGSTFLSNRIYIYVSVSDRTNTWQHMHVSKAFGSNSKLGCGITKPPALINRAR